MSAPMSMLLKVLLPSWNFFDSVGTKTEIYFQIIKNQQPTSDWQPLWPKPPRKLKHLFFNQDYNHYLYVQTLVQRFLTASTTEKKELQDFLTSQIEVMLKRSHIPKEQKPVFRYKIVASHPEWLENPALMESEKIIQSEVFLSGFCEMESTVRTAL